MIWAFWASAERPGALGKIDVMHRSDPGSPEVGEGGEREQEQGKQVSHINK